MRLPAFAFGKNCVIRKWRLLPGMLIGCMAVGLSVQPTSADTLVTQNFDTDPVNYTTSGFFVQNAATGPTGTRYFNLSNAANINLNLGITGADGVYIAVQDADTTVAPVYTDAAPPTLTFNNVGAAGVDLQLAISLAGLPTVEANNFIRAQVDMTGRGDWRNIFNFVGGNPADGPYKNGAEDLTGAFANFSYTVPKPLDGVLRLRVQSFNNTDSLNEASGFDSIVVTSTPVAPAFGTIEPGTGVATHFTEPAAAAIDYLRGTNPPGEELGFTTFAGVNTPQGVTDYAGDKQYQVNNASAFVRSELIDLRNSGVMTAGVDLRTYDLSTGFEAPDFFHVFAEVSTDGLNFTRISMFGSNGIDGNDNDLLDTLETAGGGVNGPLKHFSVNVPANVATMRFGIDAKTDSGNEFIIFDNFTLQPATPDFGTAIANAKTNFSEPAVNALNYVRGTNAPGTELGFVTTSFTTGGAQQGVIDLAGDKQFQLNNAGATFFSDLVDLRTVGAVDAKIDLRTYDLSTGFEATDFLRAFVEVSTDGLNFTRMSFFDAFGIDGNDNDPLDLLETGAGGINGPFTRFSLNIAADIAALRFGVEALNNSGNEFMLFDNLMLLLAQFPGDADGSGTVDFTDLGILLNNYNQPGTFETGDFDGSGSVDFTDLGILLNNYNQSAPTLTIAAPVPEPSSIVLAGLGLAGMFFVRRRKQA